MTQPPEYDLSLLGLAEFVERHFGHVEDMSEDRRLLVLGQFAGAVRRVQARVRELYAAADAGYYAADGGGGEAALPPLHEVMLALGAPEDWAEEGGAGGD